MINAVSAFIVTVKDKSIAMAPIGPRPGSTPTTVPSNAPSQGCQKVLRGQGHRKAVEQTVNSTHASSLRMTILVEEYPARERHPEHHAEEHVGAHPDPQGQDDLDRP